MSIAENPPLEAEKWTVIREVRENDHGFVLPKYEAKLVEGVRYETLDDEVVLLKETSAYGGERIHQLPKAVFERTARCIPGDDGSEDRANM